jgi:integrase/recombinase XerD
LKIAASGVIFFYTHTVPRDWPTLTKLRIPRPRSLPDVLSIDEVRRLSDAVGTPHNKAFFWTVYSLGLRLQEGLNLQVVNIDSARMVVHVHRGKGFKDRYVPLARAPWWCFASTG